MLDNKFEFYDLSLKMKCMKFREIFLSLDISKFTVDLDFDQVMY